MRMPFDRHDPDYPLNVAVTSMLPSFVLSLLVGEHLPEGYRSLLLLLMPFSALVGLAYGMWKHKP